MARLSAVSAFSYSLVFLVVSFFTAGLMSLVPGKPEVIVIPFDQTGEQQQAFREANNLDEPLPVRWFEWAKDFLSGDMGNFYSATGGASAGAYGGRGWSPARRRVGVTPGCTMHATAVASVTAALARGDDRIAAKLALCEPASGVFRGHLIHHPGMNELGHSLERMSFMQLLLLFGFVLLLC